MKRTNLGELEELISVHAVLTRLEEKGFLKSRMSEPTEERSGRRKRKIAFQFKPV
jgi:PadR family transcriptional regulator, regulatory protein PadR